MILASMTSVFGRQRGSVMRTLLISRGIGAALKSLFFSALAVGIVSSAGCKTAAIYRSAADRTAYGIIAEKRESALGRTEPFTIESPADTLRKRLLLDQYLPNSSPASLGSSNIEPIKQWPDDDYLARNEAGPSYADAWDTSVAVQLSLVDALRVAAKESREYQVQKERVFTAALQLDLERDQFRNTWAGTLESLYQTDLEATVALDDEGHTDRQPVNGRQDNGLLDFSRRLENGMSFAASVGVDLVSLLTQNRLFSRGLYADATITVPLMRGSGKFVVTEPLTQAERNVTYAIFEFERFKREFAVDIASEYLAVLRQLDSVQNAEDNYRRLISSTRRARRLADAGRLPEIQVDQSRQDELRARNQWVSSKESYQRQLDGFKFTLGLPVDANIELDRRELDALTETKQNLLPTSEPTQPDQDTPDADAPITLVTPGQGGAAGRYELDQAKAIIAAIDNRLDLRVAVGRVNDSQRATAVAADQLRADITLLGSGSAGERRTLGSVSSNDAILRPDEGLYSALLTIDLPLERTAERNRYRATLIELEQAVRDVQALEDQIKLDVRNGLSRLLEAREGINIQAEAVKVADRRVASTNLFLEAGRAEIRDVLEAQDALVNAQNALTAALVNYRVNELALQRDLGLLEVNEQGLWREYDPEKRTD